ncbi:MAG: hypothetical protein IH944_13615 [Armatimonadetes bacterium]|nr:hypothetical protein [Armatimonadota bacterium]
MEPEREQMPDNADSDKFRDLAEKIAQVPKEELDEAKQEEARRREKEKKDAEKR